MPLAFAGTMDEVNMKKTVSMILKSAHPGADILSVSAAAERFSRLGMPDVLVVVRKDDLTTPDGRAMTERVLRRHFL